MSNCSFADQSASLKGKYFTPGRTLDGVTYRQKIFTIHQAWGKLSKQNFVNYLNSLPANNGASCNYYADDYGNLALVVDEANRSWCSSSRINDARACTVECASDKTYPYKISDSCLTAVKNLCIDWCKRNGIRKMHWIPDLVPYNYPVPAGKQIGDGYTDPTKKSANEKAVISKYDSLPNDEGFFTLHHWFHNKNCPGPYIESKLQWICDEVNKAIDTIQVGDLVLMEVTEIKDGYAYGKVKIDEPIPPVPKGIEVGSKVTINPGAKAGGLNDNYRGKAIDPKYANGKYVDTVNKIETHRGVEEARLQHIVTWVAISSLTLVE